MSLRTDFNTASPNLIADVQRDYLLGDTLGFLLQTMSATPTETFTVGGGTLVSGRATFAITPTQVFVVNGTVGGTTGIKTLLKGPITGPGAVTPLPGQCVWDGGNLLQMNAADANTTVTVLYVSAATRTTSLGSRLLGQIP